MSNEEPRVTIEMGGPNIVIRSSTEIDRDYTTTLAHAVNAATETDTVVVIDPDPIRCDDTFAGAPFPPIEVDCPDRPRCRPAEVEVLGSGIIRIQAQGSWWTIDVANGRLCRSDTPVDHHFVTGSGWTPVVAVAVSPTRLRALTDDGSLLSSVRAHRHLPLAG